MELLEALILVSEKAANVARMCREDEHLFELLIEEKKETEANPRFVQDFKTLADVLIQETVKHDLGSKFPALKENIFGEENNVFCNQLGEEICVRVLDNSEETAGLLEQVLNGDQDAANVLADEVHKDIQLDEVFTKYPLNVQFELDYSNVGIWIDPIDSTAEYINGGFCEDENGISLSGLKCVTVLIGAFDLTTGSPIMGIVNQPFSQCSNNRFQGQCYWGVSQPIQISSIDPTDFQNNKIICLSSSENPAVKQKLIDAEFQLVEASGAGYKILTVILGLAQAYLLTKSSTFKWDTCGPQALLLSLGGNIVVYDKSIKSETQSVSYKSDHCKSDSKLENCCNRGGIIAFRSNESLNDIVKALCS